MKKQVRKTILYLLIMLVITFLPGVTAEATDIWQVQSEILDTNQLDDAVPYEALEILDGAGVNDGMDLDSGIDGIIEAVKDKSGGIFKDALKSGCAVLTAALVASVITGTFGCGDGKKNNYVVLAGVLAVSALSVGNMETFMGYGTSVINELDDFSKVLLPTLTAAAASSGAITSAAAKYAAAALFIDILITVGRDVVVPLVYVYAAACIGNAAIGGKALAGAASFVKWLAMSVLTALVVCFVLYLTLTGTITAATDEVAVKVTKTVLSTALPVVGGIISDAAGSVAGGISILKNSIGVLGLLAVAAVCVVPLMTLASNYIVYKAAAALSGAVADERISKLMGDIATAFGMIMGLVGASAVMLFVSVISLMKVVTGG